MPNHILRRGLLDPAGSVSNISAVVTAMLGIFTGEYLLKSSHSGSRKAATMAICAVVMLAIALI